MHSLFRHNTVKQSTPFFDPSIPSSPGYFSVSYEDIDIFGIYYQAVNIPRKRPIRINYWICFDPSSVIQRPEITNDTSFVKSFGETLEKEMPEEISESDAVFYMPPKKRYKIMLEIKSVRKAEPRFVETE